MIGRWFNQWVEDRLAIAITLAADMQRAVSATVVPPVARTLRADEIAALGAYCEQRGLRPKHSAKVVPFPVPHETPADPPPPPSAA